MTAGSNGGGASPGDGCAPAPPVKPSRKDFQSSAEVRWCPGCGDYGILSQVQKLLADTGVRRENVVFVSGIGCSSRFPYYMNTYGFHTIHGRALAVATGLKLARPELEVWVATGDGDALSIGGNHLIHALRRNIDVKILLFDNRIYGLTKGQHSPTSELGKSSKSTPDGSIDPPFDPVKLALGAGASFVARSIDVEAKHMGGILSRMAAHRGAAFLQILQNCVVFNDGAFAALTDKAQREDSQLRLEPGKRLVFGKDRNRGIRLRGFSAEVVTVGEDGVREEDLLLWDESLPAGLAFQIASLAAPAPTPLGIFRAVSQPSYEERGAELEARVTGKRGRSGLDRLLASGDTWTVG